MASFISCVLLLLRELIYSGIWYSFCFRQLFTKELGPRCFCKNIEPSRRSVLIFILTKGWVKYHHPEFQLPFMNVLKGRKKEWKGNNEKVSFCLPFLGQEKSVFGK